MKALLLLLEFPSWEQARPWSYSASYAIERGLLGNDVHCTTIPLLAGVPPQLSWATHLERLLGEEQFDFAFVWLVHTKFDSPLLEWLSERVPVRVGFIMEGLTYEPDLCRIDPRFAKRRGVVLAQCETMTHLLCVDEADVGDLRRTSGHPVAWWPGNVPREFLSGSCSVPETPLSMFSGVPYDDRARWLQLEELKPFMAFAKPAEVGTNFPERFEAINGAVLQALATGVPDRALLTGHVDGLRRIRTEIFRNYLHSLRRWTSVVNLPGLGRLLAGRVYEAMASCCPVVSWLPPERPQISTLLRDGEEICYFRSPAELGAILRRFQSDQGFRAKIAEGGARRMREMLTTEQVVAAVLRFIGAQKPS